jgi:hypothetical protein
MESRIAFLIIADFWVLVKGNKPCVDQSLFDNDCPGPKWIKNFEPDGADHPNILDVPGRDF